MKDQWRRIESAVTAKLVQVILIYLSQGQFIVIYNYKHYDDIHNNVMDIHKCVLNKCIDKYSRLLGYSISKIDSTYTELSQIGSTEEILNIRYRELHITFNKSKIDLLKCMCSIISKQYNSKQQGNYNIYPSRFNISNLSHKFGYVSLDIFDEDVIHNICIDAEKLYELYLNNDSYSCIIY